MAHLVHEQVSHGLLVGLKLSAAGEVDVGGDADKRR